MRTDRFGGMHSTDQSAAVDAFEQAVEAVAAHRPVGTALQSALQSDVDFVAGHALNGFAHVILGRDETIAGAAPLVETARQSLARRSGGTASEFALVEALGHAVDGHLQQAASRLDAHLGDVPTDFLALKISHALRFMSGQAADMLRVTQNVLPSWNSDHAAYGYVLGCHSFGLEENGHYGQAESIGRQAYSYEPQDAWGLHAVSHVMEMERRCNDGIAWLEQARSSWSKCNNFSFHLAWHLALFLLEKREIEAVLDVYDRDIRPQPTDDFRDVANATSMLWRLELEGVDLGDRWDELYGIASQRLRDVSYIFGSLHYLLALVSKGDRRAAETLLSTMQAKAHAETGDQAIVAAEVGIPIANIIMSTRWPEYGSGRLDIVACGEKLQNIGGSHAQRDVFLRTLLVAAAERLDTQSVLALSRIRHNLRSADRFIHAIEMRLSNGPAMSQKHAASFMIATH